MKRTIKDFIFEKSLLFLALLTLAGLAGIVWFLFKEGMPVLDTISLKHFLTGHDWYPTEDPLSFGIFPLIIGSVSVTLLAAVLAIPLGILCAIFLSEIASSRLRSIFKPFIELLAAMPSVVIGFVGMTVLAPFLQDYFGAPTGLNILNAAILLALMAVPTICTISEDALRSVPRSLKESSLALGATHWETLTTVTIPAAFSGIATGVMLGLSRVIGETMVVLMVAGGAALIPESLFDPVRPMPASIVAEMAESPFGSSHYHALFAIGIVLFFFTFLCNLAAFLVSQKYKLKASS